MPTLSHCRVQPTAQRGQMRTVSRSIFRVCSGTASRGITRAPYRTATRSICCLPLPTITGPRKAMSKSAATTPVAKKQVINELVENTFVTYALFEMICEVGFRSSRFCLCTYIVCTTVFWDLHRVMDEICTRTSTASGELHYCSYAPKLRFARSMFFALYLRVVGGRFR